MPLTALAFLVAYLGGLAAAVFNPLIGVLLYILVYHIHPQSQWWGSEVSFLGTRLSLGVAVATCLGLLIRRPRMLEGQRQFPQVLLMAGLLAAWTLGTMTWGQGITERGTYQVEKFLKILLFIVLLIRCVRTPEHYHAAVLAWLLGVLYVGYQATGGGGVTLHGRLNEGVGGPDFGESSDLAVHLVATLPWIGAMFFMARTWVGRSFSLATGALAVNTLIMTRTRNAVVGLVMITFGCVLALPRGYRVRGIAGVVVGALLAFQLTDPGWWTRMATVWDYRDDPAAIGRIAYWKAALRMAQDHPFGIGIGNFHRAVMDYLPRLTEERGAHNTYLACLAELGWPGALFFAAVLIATLRRLGQVVRSSRDLPDILELHYGRIGAAFHLGWHAVALRAGLLGYLGSALFTTRTFSEDLWLMLAFGMCLENVTRHLAARPAAAAASAPGEPVRIPPEPNAAAAALGNV